VHLNDVLASVREALNDRDPDAPLARGADQEGTEHEQPASHD
jgi:hypothetical protein